MIDQYNVVWKSQSANASESMPVGGHSLGLNVWVEKGDILFYAQRSGCFDENNEYLKLGRIRLQLDPNPFLDGETFRQELKLRQGHVEICGKRDGLDVWVRIWVEARRPVVHVDIEANREVSAKVAYEGWRNEVEQLDTKRYGETFGCLSWDSFPGEVFRYPDVVRHEGDTVLFYHRNRNDKLLFDYAVTQQGLEEVKDRLANTQVNRTFGGLLTGDGFVAAGTGAGSYLLAPYKAWTLKSGKPRRTHAIRVFTHIDQAESLDAWKRALRALSVEEAPDARDRTLAWWKDFWERSWLVLNPGRPDPSSRTWQLGRNYQLFRYQLGCNFYGDYPTKFNGGNFTFDAYPALHKSHGSFTPGCTPDWRAWGGGSFTAQNQRLLYWPMLKTGDFEAMFPQFEFYRRALPTAKARVQAYWGHDGCCFTEQIENYGLPIACGWGWTEPGAKARARPANTEHGVMVNGAIRYHYESQLEFSFMILEWHRYTGGDISPYMAFIKQSVRFYDEHYQMRHRTRAGKPLDENGKLVIFPSTSCESYKDATNPADAVAGLLACLDALLSLPARYVSDAEKADFRECLQRVPDLPFGEANGDRILQPAASWSRRENCECPQFYALFPFNRFQLGVDDMAVFHNTWKHGDFPKDMVMSWHQDGIFFARMGLTEAAKDYNTKKMEDGGLRFPTFWGPGHDWVPDHNWGGSGMIGVQEMLMQTIGDKIVIFPAWPRTWDVDFKLHAPHKTTVEVSFRAGKLLKCDVKPASRKKDVVIHEPQPKPFHSDGLQLRVNGGVRA